MRFVVFQMRKVDRQLVFVNTNHYPSRLTRVVQFMQYRERFAPESLPAEKPIAQFVIDRKAA